MLGFVRKHRPALAWAAAALVLLLIIFLESDWGRAWWRAPTPMPAAIPKPVTLSLLQEYALPGGVQAYSETLNRPLFTPNRRPAPPSPLSVSLNPAMQKGQFALMGTLITMKGESYALLREVSSGKMFRAAKGTAINGIVVSHVDPNRVTLQQGEDTEVVPLKIAAASNAPGRAPAPPGHAPLVPPPAQPNVGVPAVQGATAAAPRVVREPAQPNGEVAPPTSYVTSVPPGSCPPGTPCAEEEAARRQAERFGS